MRFNAASTIGESLGLSIRKPFNLAVAGAIVFSFGATPAFANTLTTPIAPEVSFSAVSSQGLSTITANTRSPEELDSLLELAAMESGPEAGFDVSAAIELAKSELGTSRVTGWSMPGECIMSARRWVQHGGGNWGEGGTPVSNYINATLIPMSLIQPGDIIQYENIYYPDAWVSGVHTMMVTAVHEDGSIDIIQSNIPYGSGLVTEEFNWTPEPPAGFQTSIWRF